MIIYYNKKNGKVLGTQDMKFVDDGARMLWSDVNEEDIGVTVLGGIGKIYQNKSGKKTLVVKKDKHYKKIREFEDTPTGDSGINGGSPLDYIYDSENDILKYEDSITS